MKSIATLLLTMCILAAVASAQTSMPRNPMSVTGPDIDVQSAFAFGVVLCDSFRVDSLLVRNSGDATLTVIPSITGTDQTRFTILRPQPNVQFSLAPQEERWIVIQFQPGGTGLKSAILNLALNTPAGSRQIPLVGELREYSASLEETQLDFGQICIGQRVQKTVRVFYQGGIDNRISSPVISNDVDRVFTIVKPDTTQESAILHTPIDTGEVVVEFHPTSVGTFSGDIDVPVGQCNLILKFSVKGSAVFIKDSLETPKPNIIDFGQVAVGGAKPSQLRIRNYGSSPSTVEAVLIKPDSLASEFQLPTSIIGNVVPGTGLLKPTLTFKPTKLGADSGVFCIVMGSGSCLDTVRVRVFGEGVAPVLALSRTKLNFTVDSCSEPALVIYDTVYLYNRGTYPSQIRSAVSDNPKIQVTTIPQLAYVLQPNDSIALVVAVSPGQPGASTGQIIITTDDPDPTRQKMFLDVFMKLESTVIKLLLGDGSTAPAGLDFGNTFGCGPKRDTFKLRNAGTLDAIVKGGLTQGTAFKIVPQSPYLIQGNRDTALLVTFDPPVSGVYHDTLMLQNGICSDQVIRLAMAGRRYDLTEQVLPLDFGPSNLGLVRSGASAFINTSATPPEIRMRISDVFVRPSSAPYTVVAPAPGDLPADLSADEALNAEVLFQPQQKITYDAELCYVTASPCPDTICVPLTGQGITSDLWVRQSVLNFGTRYNCQGDSTLILSIVNTGSNSLEIQGLNILPGVNASAFTRMSSVDFPRTIGAGDSLVVIYRFNPADASSDGVITATLEVLSNDSQLPSVKVILMGRRRSFTLNGPTAIDFGSLMVNLTQGKTITLTNSSPDTIRIDQLNLKPPFAIKGLLPAFVAPFDSVQIDLEFSPTDSLVYADTLWVPYGGICFDTLGIALTGRGIPPMTGFATITIPTTISGQPDDRLAIPLLLESGRTMTEVDAKTFEARIRFNRTLLDPLGVRGRNLVSPKIARPAISDAQIVSIDSTLDGDQMEVHVRVTNDPMPTAPDTLGFLDMQVLLGNATSTPIRFDTVIWINTNVVTKPNDGVFTLTGYCTAGGDRLLRVTGAFGIKAAVPNPFNPSTDIIFETAEAGPTSLMVYDHLGRRVATLIEEERLPVQAHVVTWDASIYPSGLYYVELTTPTQRSIHELLLVK